MGLMCLLQSKSVSYTHLIEDLKSKNITENDTIVGLAASGRTPYVIGGLEYANKIGALTVSITCNANSEVAKDVYKRQV